MELPGHSVQSLQKNASSLGLFEQFDQVVLPERRNRMSAVAACFLAQGENDGATLRDALDFALQNSELPAIVRVKNSQATLSLGDLHGRRCF